MDICQRLVELIGRTYRDYADSDPHFYRHSVFGFERTFYKCVDYIKEQIRRHQEKALAALAEREARAAAAREEAQRQADAQQDPEDEDTTSDSDKENADEEQEDFPHDNDGTFQPEDTDFPVNRSVC